MIRCGVWIVCCGLCCTSALAGPKWPQIHSIDKEYQRGTWLLAGVCGDGTIENFEECDDGALVGGDGCSLSCQVEPGFTCLGEPSACVPAPLATAPKTIYLTEVFSTPRIRRSELDGSNIATLVNGPNAYGLALDDVHCKMYWTDRAVDKIQRANLDGTDVEDLVTAGLSDPWGIALDLASGKIYWADPGAGRIQRANFDGTNIENVVIGLSTPRFPVIDSVELKLYWTEAGFKKVQRANLDGTNVEDIVSGLDDPWGIALDRSSGKLYWTDAGTNQIQRSNLDGSAIEVVANSSAETFTLDLFARKIYWTTSAVQLFRSDLDGSDAAVLRGDLADGHGIALSHYLPGDCVVASCGDGLIDPGEFCDDANSVDGDGCSSTCTTESGWNCSGAPSICAEVCGDGIVTASEQCDGASGPCPGLCLSNCRCTTGKVPTVSEWGLVVMTLLGLTIGTILNEARTKRLPEQGSGESLRK